MGLQVTGLQDYRTSGSELLRIMSTFETGSVPGGALSFFVRSVRGRRNTEALSHTLMGETLGWGPDTDGGELFSVDRTTGTLSTAGPLDREYQSQYEVQVIVSDGSLWTVTPVYVTVSDINDNAPQFLETVYRVSVVARPGLRRRAAVVRVYAKDVDADNNAVLTYSLKNKPKSAFRVHSKTGTIITKAPLVAGDTHDLLVEVRDGGRPSLWASARVLIRVVAPPPSSSGPPSVVPPAPAHLMETDPPGHLVAFISASPSDPGNQLWYSITGGDTVGHFSVGVDSGLVTVARPLDRELQPRYALTITITDGVHIATVQLPIVILDSNDHAPIFSSPLYSVAVAENATPGTAVATLLCRDKDHTDLASSHATDQLSHRDTAEISDLNSHDERSTEFSGSSSESSGHNSAAYVTPLYFSLEHGEALISAELFSVNSATGVVSVAQPLDREVSPTHLLTVSCRDRGARSNADFARVLVTLTDTNDHWPLFAERSVTAQGKRCSLLFDYIVEGNDDGFFTMDSAVGVLRLARSLHQRGTHQLIIRATDHAPEPRSASLQVSVTVTPDQNDPPSWGTSIPGGGESQVHKTVGVSEWAPRGTAIALVAASSPKSALRYAITDGDDEETAMFFVTPASGVVSLAAPLDREARPHYNLTVTATNARGVSRSTWVAISVVDENDQRPQWRQLEYMGAVLEGAKVGTLVFDVTDALSPSNGSSSSNINKQQTRLLNLKRNSRETSHDHSRNFNHVPFNPTSTLDFDAVQSSNDIYHGLADYSANVLPNFLGTSTKTKRNPEETSVSSDLTFEELVGTVRSSIGTASSNVDPINSLTQAISSRVIGPIRHLQELSPLVVSATDADVGANGRVRYSLAGQNKAAQFFSVDSVTGAVRVAGDLSSLSGRILHFSVWASDSGSPSLEALTPTRVSIMIEKENLSPPQFKGSTRYAEVYLPTVPGVQVMCLEAFDPDDSRGMNSTITRSEIPSSVVPTVLTYSLKSRRGDDIDDLKGKLYRKQHPADEENIVGDEGLYERRRREDGTKDDGMHFDIDSKTGCIFVNTHKLPSRDHRLVITASDGLYETSADVVVSVAESLENSLRFTQERYFAHVSENSTKKINLLVVEVENAAPGDHIRYSILNPNGYLTVSSTSGVVQTTGKPFDREKQEHFSLIVQARETRSGRSGNGEVTVAVLDTNDNAPVFMGQPYIVLLPTAATAGHLLCQVRAVDADSGVFGSVRYELHDSSDHFTIEADTGKVSLSRPTLLLEAFMTLEVSALDGGTPPLSAKTFISVRIVSATGPVFSSPVFHGSVAEDATVGTAVLRLTAESPTGAALVYTIVAGDRGRHFALDFSSGVLQVARPLDFETQRWHNLTVRVRDPVIGVYADAVVTVAVTDVNDNRPQFQTTTVRATVSEAAVPGTLVTKMRSWREISPQGSNSIPSSPQNYPSPHKKVVATDLDTGDSGRVRYGCLYGCSLFTVAATGGEVVLMGDLDADGGDGGPVEYTLTVIASDTGLTPLNATATVIVTVEDFNDNAPVWAASAFTTRVSTAAAPGQSLTAVRAADPDKSDVGKLRYEIVPDTSSRQPDFVVHPVTGVVSVVQPDLLLGMSFVQLNVSVTDSVHASFAPLNVSIVPTNNNPPKFSRTRYEGHVLEEAPPGTGIVRLEAHDPDPGVYGHLTFAIVGDNHAALFAIDDLGTLSTLVPLDRESESVYTVVVSATDGGGKTDFSRVRILVDDVNDNAPIFALPQYQANVRVDTGVDDIILKVATRDADDGLSSTVTYAMYESNSSLALHMFHIDTHTGSIHLKQAAAGQANAVYQFFVRATDGGSPPLHSDVPVSAFLLPPTHTRPHCPRPFQRFFLLEDAAVGTVVTNLWAGGPMPVQYWLVTDGDMSSSDDAVPLSDDEPPQFSVSSSGDVILSRALDHETSRSHEIIVVNQTLTTPPSLDYMTIEVVVMDVNDNPPTFGSVSYSVDAAENTAVGATVLLLTAADRDAGNNGQVSYGLSPSTRPSIARLIHVTPETGAVTLIAPLDREVDDRLTFSVIASDGGSVPLSASAVVVISVKDYNDNPPVFSSSSYEASVPEDAQPGAVIIQLVVEDADLQQQHLDFFIADGDDAALFYVDNTGQVRVAGSLDRETRATYSLSITVSDGSFAARTRLSVIVLDVNDNGPVCPTSEYRLTVSEAAKPGQLLMRVDVQDADVSPNDVSRSGL
ncbi:Cadherin [Trinorchestia longiramus]|nr:Cadherin [Trinorchestia longiramus]